MVKTIFLDLDNTLLDFDRAEAAALSKALEQAGITPSAAVLERYHELNAQHWKMLEDGILTRDQVLTGRFAALFVELGISASAQEICDCYEHLLAQEPVSYTQLCGLCTGICPEVFTMTDEGVAKAIDEEVDRDLATALDAMQNCPVQAIEAQE